MASWQSLSNQIYTKINEMNAAIARVGSAANNATVAVEAANNAAKAAAEAAALAAEIADAAKAEADKWNAATAAVVETLEPTESAANSVTLEDLANQKKFSFRIVRGEPGVDGRQGDPGLSGVDFNLSGNALYITMK